MTQSLPDGDAAVTSGAVRPGPLGLRPPGASPSPPAGLPLLPTRELIVFPKMVAPLFVGRAKSILAIETAFNEKTSLILSSQRDAAVEDP